MFSLDEFLKCGAIMSLGSQRVLLAYGPFVQFSDEQQLDKTKPAFFFTDFFLNESHPWFQFSSFKEFSIDELMKLFSSEKDGKVNWNISHKQVFQNSFNQLQKLFSIGKLEKAVPYAFSYADEKMSFFRLQNTLLNALLNIQKFPGTVYGYWNDGKGVIGVTPEILFMHRQSSSSIMETMALAGTLSPKNDQIDSKLKHEHQIVVDSIYQSLKPYGTLKKQSMELLKLSKLTHLKTSIQLTLKEPFHFISMVNALHPTPALGAYPLEEGHLWLKDYETQIPRKHFGAPIGLLYSGLSSCYVAIRQVQWNKDGMRIGAGCGIVKESLCEEEWNEIELKITAIKELLAL
jgi:isochorismate synthase EntC